MKIIVTHKSVDIDCITACWLIKRHLPDWKDAEIKHVNAGSSLNDLPPDSDPDIIHVDTGFGKFDHHQSKDNTSATSLVCEFLISKNQIPEKNIKAVEKLSFMVNEFDHFKEVYFPEAASDRYDFMLHQIIEGLKGPLGKDEKIIDTVFILLDAILQILRNKVRGEEAIAKGFIFESKKYGKCIVMESQNEEAMKLAMKSGFKLAAKKDPIKGNIRIKTLPDKKYDLNPIFDQIKKYDKKATWFMHVSGNMLLNSSSKNPNFVPSSLSVSKLIEIIRNI
ncbi:MAG: hypothetical protein Q7R95_04500 [bacterium]|nr:hypothetical protein [bacterium]